MAISSRILAPSGSPYLSSVCFSRGVTSTRLASLLRSTRFSALRYCTIRASCRSVASAIKRSKDWKMPHRGVTILPGRKCLPPREKTDLLHTAGGRGRTEIGRPVKQWRDLARTLTGCRKGKRWASRFLREKPHDGPTTVHGAARLGGDLRRNGGQPVPGHSLRLE